MTPPIEPVPPLKRPQAAGSLRIGGAALLLTLVGACSAPPIPQGERLRGDDCLRDVQIDDLQDSLRRCDAVVEAFPADPRPLSERFVLHTLNGDQAAACRDIEQAATLLEGLRTDAPAASEPEEASEEEPEPEQQLAIDIRVRLESCRDKPPLPAP